MTRFPAIVFLLAATVILAACGGGSPNAINPPPPPPPFSPAFVYLSNTSANALTGVNVAGGKPANLATALPPPGGNGPVGLAATGKWLYIANSGSGTVSGFNFNSSTGGLQPLPGSPYLAGAGVSQLALCPGNGGATIPRFIYAVTPAAVLGYAIAGDGQLTPISGSPFTAATQPAAVLGDSACNFLFVANSGSNNVSVFSVNSGSGFLTPVSGSPFPAGTAPVALAMGDGLLFAANSGSNNVSVYMVNTTAASGTGFLTQVANSPFSAGAAPSALVYFSPTLYVANSASNNVSAFAVAPTTGAFTAVSGSPFSVGAKPMAMVTLSPPASNVAQQMFLYVANAGSNDLSAFTLGQGGILTAAPGFPFPAGTDPQGLVFACGTCGYP
jgi:hypothetical protein